MKRVTIKDVAEESNVSISVVSYVLNNPDGTRISNETRKRIMENVENLGYIPNRNAAILRSGRSYNLGVVSYWDSNSYSYNAFIEGIKIATERLGYNVFIYPTSLVKNNVDYIRYFQDRFVDGLILIPPYGDLGEFDLTVHIDALKLNKIPFAVIGEPMDEYEGVISIDFPRSTYVATKYFIDKGIKDITYISPPLTNKERKLRFVGYQKAMREFDLKVDFCLKNDVDSRIRDFKVVVTNKSHTAYTVLCSAIENGLKVPDDFEIIGANTEYYSKYFYPPLTTVDIPAKEIGIASVESVVRQINNDNTPLENNYDYRIDFRESTK